MTFAEQLPGPPSDMLSTMLGIAAIVLVAGWALNRWQRDRLRFGLMRVALEKGVTRFPGTPPYWLVSLRQGVTLLAVGAALGIVGSGAWWLARGVEMPPTARTENTQPAQRLPVQGPGGVQPHLSRDDHDGQGPPHGGPPGRQEGGPPDSHRPPPPLREDPLGLGPGHGPPGGGEEGAGRSRQPAPPQAEPGGGRQPRPEPADPARERWHRAEAQQTIGLVTVGAGFILVLLGIVRIGFAKVERRFASESDESGIY